MGNEKFNEAQVKQIEALAANMASKAFFDASTEEKISAWMMPIIKKAVEAGMIDAPAAPGGQEDRLTAIEIQLGIVPNPKAPKETPYKKMIREREEELVGVAQVVKDRGF